jgi:hypothetical protein
MLTYSVSILKKLAKMAAEATANKAFDDWQEGETVNDYIRRHGYHLVPDPMDLSQRTKQQSIDYPSSKDEAWQASVKDVQDWLNKHTGGSFDFNEFKSKLKGLYENSKLNNSPADTNRGAWASVARANNNNYTTLDYRSWRDYQPPSLDTLDYRSWRDNWSGNTITPLVNTFTHGGHWPSLALNLAYGPRTRNKNTNLTML